MNAGDRVPLPETNLLILLSLARAPRHGYAILQDVAALSEGRLRLSTGALYGALRRMLAQGWIQRFDDGTTTEEGRARKSYRLTDEGRKILNAGAARRPTPLSTVRQSKPA